MKRKSLDGTRTLKALRLHRETLRRLEDPQLEVALGGLRSEIITSCNGCNTRNTCTTRFC